MRRLLAVAALSAVATLSAPAAHAAYTCVPKDSDNAVCVQVTECTDPCFLAPGAYVKCYLGVTGEAVCRIVRLLGVEVGGH